MFQTHAVSICTRILKYRVWKIEFDELDFLSISNSNLAGYTGSKNLVQTSQKFQFIKLDFSNSIFQNPSADRYRVRFVLTKVTFYKIHILVLFKRYKDFFWTCSFLAKNLSDFVPLVLKLHTTDIDINFKKHFFFLGKGAALNDCADNKLRLYTAPPPNVWTLKGSYPMVKFYFAEWPHCRA